MVHFEISDAQAFWNTHDGKNFARTVREEALKTAYIRGETKSALDPLFIRHNDLMDMNCKLSYVYHAIISQGAVMGMIREK